MEGELIITYGLEIFIIILQWIIVLALIFRAKRTKLNNFYILVLTLFLEGFGAIFFTRSLYLIAFIMFDIAIWSHLIFIRLTFYKDRKNPISILLALIIPISIIHWIFSGIYNIGLNTSFLLYFVLNLLYSILMFFTYGWMAYSMIKSYLNIRNNKMLEPWIKARYLLVITYVIGKLLMGILMPLFPVDRTILDWSLMISGLVAFYIVFAQFLAWVMPKGLKKWLNRNFTDQKDEKILSEENIMKSLEET